MPIDLNYHHLYYFWNCARAGSLTAAARSLGLSQSALSLQLKSLERAFGRRLLDRTRSGVRLTEDGRLVFEHCERIFSEGAALSAALRLRKAGPVQFRLGVSSALGREVVLGLLGRLGDQKTVSPTVFIGPREDVLNRLSRGRLDLAVVGIDASRWDGSEFRSRRLDSLPLVFVATPAIARGLAGFPRRGQQVPMIFRTRETPVRDSVESWLRDRGVLPVSVAETEDSELLREFARLGMGVAALHSASVRADLSSGRLKRLGAGAKDLIHEIWAVVPARPPADPALRAVLDRVLAGGPFLR